MSRLQPPASPDDVDIAALGRAVWARRHLLLALTLGASVITYAILSSLTPLYTAEANVLIDQEDSAFRRPTSATVERERLPDAQAVASQVQVLLSRDLAEAVVKDLKLTEDPEFTRLSGLRRALSSIGLLGAPSPEKLQQRALDAFAERLAVFQVGTSRVIAIRFTSERPETASAVANRLAQVYLGWQQREKLRQTREASDWLSRQIAELRKQVEEAEAKVEEFRSQTGLYSGQNNTTLSSQQLSELNSQLILARAQRSEAEARANLIETMLKEKGDVEAASDVLRSELIQRLLEQRVLVQRQLAELSATLLPSHPRMRQLRSELADLRSQINDEARKIVRSLRNEAQIAGAREASLRSSLDELKKQSALASENEIKLRALEREAKANRDLLESYLARFRDASARRDELSVPADASIIARAHAPNTPSFPRKGPMTALVVASVALLSLAFIVARALLSGHALAAASRPAVAAPARVEEPIAPPPSPPEDEPAGVIGTRSLPDLARRIAVLIGEGPRRRVAICGEGGGGGAGEAIALARRLDAAHLRVALVDLSAGQVSHMLGLPAAPGIADLVAGAVPFEQVVAIDPRSSVQVFARGRGQDRSAESIEALAPILRALDDTYDCVLLFVEHAEMDSFIGSSGEALSALVLVAAAERGRTAGAERALSLARDHPEVTVFRYEGARSTPSPMERLRLLRQPRESAAV